MFSILFAYSEENAVHLPFFSFDFEKQGCNFMQDHLAFFLLISKSFFKHWTVNQFKSCLLRGGKPNFLQFLTEKKKASGWSLLTKFKLIAKEGFMELYIPITWEPFCIKLQLVWSADYVHIYRIE
uniref:Uncharacterized protein n=1 Tax=Micrurus paraensis TaxID=1970185 RepID=A0A2D4K813_9SAUR